MRLARLHLSAMPTAVRSLVLQVAGSMAVAAFAFWFFLYGYCLQSRPREPTPDIGLDHPVNLKRPSRLCQLLRGVLSEQQRLLLNCDPRSRFHPLAINCRPRAAVRRSSREDRVGAAGRAHRRATLRDSCRALAGPAGRRLARVPIAASASVFRSAR